MPSIIPLQPIPNQTLQVQLGGQAATLNVYQYLYGLFVDLLVGGEPILLGVIGLDRTLIVRRAYYGFTGDIAFMDTLGVTDPVYTGFGANGRYQLLYLTPDEVASIALPGGN